MVSNGKGLNFLGPFTRPLAGDLAFFMLLEGVFSSTYVCYNLGYSSAIGTQICRSVVLMSTAFWQTLDPFALRHAKLWRIQCQFLVLFASFTRLLAWHLAFSDLLSSCQCRFLSFDAFIYHFRSFLWNCFMQMIDRPVAVVEGFRDLISLQYTGHYAKPHIQTTIFINIGTLFFFCRFF